MNNILHSIYTLSELSLLELLLYFYIALYITTTLHEGLHFIVAKLLEFDVHSLHITGGPTLFKSNQLTFGLLPMKNYVLWDMNRYNYEKTSCNFRVATVFLFGPIGNLITALVTYPFINSGSPIADMMFVLSTVLFITNILPIVKGTDGYHICNALYHEFIKHEKYID